MYIFKEYIYSHNNKPHTIAIYVYTRKVEQLAFSFDGGVTNLNFAEAALLIQGSACVYSRKVGTENLYDIHLPGTFTMIIHLMLNWLIEWINER